MLYKWLVLPILRRFYDTKRAAMLAEYHKISTARHEKVLLGLKLLLEAPKIGVKPVELVPSGLELLRTPTAAILLGRLQWCIQEYNTQSYWGEVREEWSNWPTYLDPAKDTTEARWLDMWFGTNHHVQVREMLQTLHDVLEDNELLFVDNGEELNGIFQRLTSHILRDLDTVILKYLPLCK